MNRLNNELVELTSYWELQEYEILAKPIADIFNRALTEKQTLSPLGQGVLILLSKPGKPVDAMTSLRPNVLLDVLRKTLSLVVFARVVEKVDVFCSQGQSGFRHRRSTTDVILGYHWKSAKMQRFQSSVCVLGIDMSRAFDTIRRDKLMTVLETFFGNRNCESSECSLQR